MEATFNAIQGVLQFAAYASIALLCTILIKRCIKHDQQSADERAFKYLLDTRITPFVNKLKRKSTEGITEADCEEYSWILRNLDAFINSAKLSDLYYKTAVEYKSLIQNLAMTI